MKNRLFIIGNGFDLAHNLPTDFKKDFKDIAESNESNRDFWNLYQTEISDIWSDFEYCLGKPNFNSLEKIFYGYEPDYQSDYERDREAIITQVDISGNLKESLYEFADRAEDAIESKIPLSKFKNFFSNNDIFISVNYTHTLERIYNIKESNVLHIHGEVGQNNLLIGYPKGEYKPKKYCYDPTQKGRGRHIDIDIEDYVKRMGEEEVFDYYTLTAYRDLIDKTKSFFKEYREERIASYLDKRIIEEVIVLGHSCKIDFPYFDYILKKFPNAKWFFNPYKENDILNVRKLINKIGIVNYVIHSID